MSPAGGIGEKSLLTLGSAGGVYFFSGSDANGFFSSFLAAASPFMNRFTCLTKKMIPMIQSATTAASSRRSPNSISENVKTHEKNTQEKIKMLR